MKRAQVLNFIKSFHGQIMSAKFVKKDGTVRNINFRLGVKKDLVGGKNTVSDYPQYLTVYDMQKQAYRNLNLDSVSEVRAGKAVLSIPEKENELAVLL